MILVHKNCMTKVDMEVSDAFKIIVNPQISGTKLKVQSLSLSKVEGKTLERPTKFYCNSCKTYVEVEELLGSCEHCNDLLPLDELFSLESYPTVMCDAGLKGVLRLGVLPENAKKLTIKSIVQKLYLSR